jgi:hypothetical protein
METEDTKTGITETRPEGAKPSTYTESHKKYYERYKPLINARRKKYASAYKKMWWKKNRERVLQERALKRLAEKGLKNPTESST